MEKQFPFDNAGVVQWQEDLKNAGESVLQNERKFIESDFIKWLPTRFVLTPEQLAYAELLGPLTHQTYGVAISNALAQNTPIVLEKETDGSSKNDNPYENPKLNEIRDWFKVSPSSDSSSLSKAGPLIERRLTVRIYYQKSTD